MDSQLRNAGTLSVNGELIPLEWAECTLFAGRVAVEFAGAQTNGSLSNLHFENAVTYAELSGRGVESRDCQASDAAYGLYNPLFCIEFDYPVYCYPVSKLKVDPIQFNAVNETLTLQAKLEAMNDEIQSRIQVELAATTQCTPIDASYVTHSHVGFPVRFANHYLPIIGMPCLPETATRIDVERLLGSPDDEGGGPHPLAGRIPDWIRYTLNDCFVRFELDCGEVTRINVMPRHG